MLELSQRRYAAGIDSEYQLQQTQSLEAAADAVSYTHLTLPTIYSV